MSGGGFYKYRCKYFYIFNCPNWVWVRGAACASCLAEGRETEDNIAATPTWRLSKDIFVPQVHDGTLHYTLMEIVATNGESGGYWTLKQKTSQPPASKTAVTTTSSTPNPTIPTTGAPSHMGF